MTAGERQRLVAHFEMTESWLDDEVRHLSDAQLKFKIMPTSWSVEEVVRHLHIMPIREVKAHSGFPRQ